MIISVATRWCHILPVAFESDITNANKLIEVFIFHAYLPNITLKWLLRQWKTVEINQFVIIQSEYEKL